MKHTAHIIAVIVTVALSLMVGCKKPDASIPTRFGTLFLHLHSNIGSNEVVLGQSYPSQALGMPNISIVSARYYISQVTMTDSTGKVVNVPGVVLVQAGTETYAVGQIPIGNYKTISFKVGLDNYSNHSDPTQFSAGNALAPQSPSMHFANVDSGYFFIDLRGNVDTSGGGTPNAAYICQIGVDANLVTVNMPDHKANLGSYFTVTESQPVYVHLTADFGQLLRSVDLVHNLTIKPNLTPVMVNTIKENAQLMFTYEE